METTELSVRNTGLIQTVDDLSRIGKMMAISGYFQDARDAAQAAVKVQAGMEMGFGPFASMTGIHIIQGRPAVGANLMAAAVKGNPKYDYRVREMSAEVCKIEFFEIIGGKRESLGVSEFTIKEAKTAGVKNLDKFPRNMLFARAMSNGIRWFCPDVFAGNPTYTPEELGVEVDDDGFGAPVDKDGYVTVDSITAPRVEQPEPQKKRFDDSEFLRSWNEKVTVIAGDTQIQLPDISMEAACEIDTRNSDGTVVKMGERKTGELAGMWKAYKNRLADPNANRDDVLMRLSAVNKILTARAKAQSDLDNL